MYEFQMKFSDFNWNFWKLNQNFYELHMKMVAKNPNEMHGKEYDPFHRLKFSANRFVQGENF